jgi:hypothetical protein
VPELPKMISLSVKKLPKGWRASTTWQVILSLLSFVDSSFLKDLAIYIGVGVVAEEEDYEIYLDSFRAQEAA